MNNYKDKYLEYYNSAYVSLLNKVPYDILINNFLDKINNLFNIDRSSLIAQINKKNNSLYNLNISRKNIVKSKQKIDISLKPTFNLENENCLINDSIKFKKTIIKENVSYNKIFGSTFSENIDFNVNIMIIPLIFNNNINGIMCLLTTFNLLKYESDANILSNLLGTLLFNYDNLKYSIDDTYSKNKFLVYQIIGDILNLINDGLIILNNSFSIKYFNEISFNLIKEIYPDISENTLMNEYIADIFTPFYTLINENKKNYFKNKTLDFTKGYLKVKFFLNTLIIRNDLYHIITIYKNENVSNNKKFCNNIIGYLSHELRNPIQSISNGCFILNYELINNNTENIKTITDNLSRNCKDMSVIIDDVLDLSKINSGEFIISLEICNIYEMINIVISDFNDLAVKKNLNLFYNISDNVPETLYTDPTRIYQILSNLVSNSIKYSNYGIININVNYDKKNHGINFEIKDQGKGIKDVEVCNLFKEYGVTTNSHNNKSNGLGLCVSQKIANLLGGNIIVDTEYNKGSTFTLFHPIKLGSSGKKFNQKLNFGENLNANILIIDSHLNSAMIFKMFLNTINIKHNTILNVDIVENQEKAINLLDNNNYQLIFIDLNQNYINGITLSNIFRKKYSSNLKLIATTGNINFNNKDILTNFNDILIKPFDDISILKILSKNLEISSVSTNN